MKTVMSLPAIMLHVAGVGLTLGIAFPLTSLVLEDIGAADWQIGIAGSASSLAILALMPFLPKLIRRFGLVRSMCFGALTAAMAVMLMLLLQGFAAWTLLRFVMGAGLALPWLAGDVWVNAAAPERRRGLVVTAYVSCLFLGFALGPLVLDRVGFGPLAHISAMLALVLAVVPLIIVRRAAPQVDVAPRNGLRAVFAAAPLVAIAAFAAGLTEGVGFSLLTVWAVETGLGTREALTLLSTFILGGISLQLLVGLVADAIPRDRLLGFLGLTVAVLGVMLAIEPSFAPSTTVFLLGGAVLGLYGIGLALLGQRFAPSELSAASATFLVLYQLGSVTGPVVAGAAAGGGAGAIPLAIGVAGAVVTGTSLVSVIWSRRLAGRATE